MVAASNMQPATARNPMVICVVCVETDLFVIDASAMLPLSHVWHSAVFWLDCVQLLNSVTSVLAGGAKNVTFVFPIGRHRAFDPHAALPAGKQRHQCAIAEQCG